MVFKLGRIEHIGICVNNLDETLKTYSTILGFKIGYRNIKHVGFKIKEGEIVISSRGSRVAFITTGNTNFEFIEIKDWDRANKIGRRLGIDHVAFVVDDLKSVLKELKAKGIDPLEGFPKSDTIVYLRTSEGALIELFDKTWKYQPKPK